MTITDNERREVARRLRENAKYVSKYDDIDCVLNDILRGEEKQKGINEDCTVCRRATLVELADLIEPSYDRDALMTLANECDIPGCGLYHQEQRRIARRIRRALGVNHATSD